MSSVKSKEVRRNITNFKCCDPKLTDACTFGFNRELKIELNLFRHIQKGRISEVNFKEKE